MESLSFSTLVTRGPVLPTTLEAPARTHHTSSRGRPSSSAGACAVGVASVLAATRRARKGPRSATGQTSRGKVTSLASKNDDFLDVVVVGGGFSVWTSCFCWLSVAGCRLFWVGARWGPEAMALPALRKPVTIARPKRGRHGVFSGMGDDGGLDEAKPSMFSEASTWSQVSWTTQVSSPPRSMGPFDPEDTGDLELAPKGWAQKVKAVDPRATDVKRLRTDEEELAEARRALRSVKPGDWHAQAFVHYKKKLKDEGRWLALPGLVDLVRKSSEAALEAGSYQPNRKSPQVRLSQKSRVQWVNMESCVEPEPCQGLAPPPLVVSHKTPLEAAGVLGRHFKGHPVIVTFEATEFERSDHKKGQMIEGEAQPNM
eukprot:symbB.v1.2.004968.t1/scaffold284.1/size240047/8